MPCASQGDRFHSHAGLIACDLPADCASGHRAAPASAKPGARAAEVAAAHCRRFWTPVWTASRPLRIVDRAVGMAEASRRPVRASEPCNAAATSRSQDLRQASSPDRRREGVEGRAPRTARIDRSASCGRRAKARRRDAVFAHGGIPAPRAAARTPSPIELFLGARGVR